MHSSGWVWFREADVAHARDDNARLRAVLGHCPTGIAVLDETGNLVGYNNEFKSLFSTPPPLGEPVAQLFAEGSRAMLAEVVALAGTKQRAGAMLSMHTTVGEEHDFEFLVATLPGEGTRTIGVVMAENDRTERIREESERSLLARSIGDANCNRAIDLAQSAMCHDINNVLGVLTLTVGWLQARCGAADSEVCTMLSELDDAVKHGREIVARARSQAQVVAARGDSDSTDVRECVHRAAQVVAPLARGAKVTIAINVLGDALVPLGGTELTQVLTNLMTNSVHAIEDARRPGRIDVTVECPTPNVVSLCVRDDGIGIEPSRLVDSFDAFQTTRATRGGTGLGLAIAREIVEGAGGHIDVLSTPGRATEMRLELPVAARAANATVA
jgi:signal transduction histidine kinase